MFSGFVFAVPTRDQTAEMVARILFEEVIQRYGCPERLLSNQVPAFESVCVLWVHEGADDAVLPSKEMWFVNAGTRPCYNY